MFSHAKLLWIVSLRRARINFPAIAESCHCIMCKCLLWLKAEGQVQGLRSVTSSQCLSFITTPNAATHPWLFFFLFLSSPQWIFLTYEVVTLCDNMTLGYCFNTCEGGKVGVKHTERSDLVFWPHKVFTAHVCMCVCMCSYVCLLYDSSLWRTLHSKYSRIICGLPLQFFIQWKPM